MAKILITGGSGFIGRHLSHELVKHGYQVRILDALIDQVHQGGPVTLDGATELVRADIRERAALDDALEDVDQVVHLAAEVGVGQSMYEIARYVGANDLGTAVLLEAMIGRDINKLVVASSMSVYGEGLYQDRDGRCIPNARRKTGHIAAGDWEVRSEDGEALRPVATDETKPVDLASIYALTKYAQERQALIFGEAYAVDTVALRLFNVFGMGQALSNPYTGVLANFASRLATGEAPLIFEDGEQRRDFVHVGDVATAFRLALETPGIGGEVINIGSGRAYRVADVATLLADAMGRPDIRPEVLGKVRKGDIRNCFADISKARTLLGFEPGSFLEGALDEFTAWVRGEAVVDNAAQMQRELELRGLVS
ncbi:MAG: NAD-dependent epimerase/dehydratase family protein [Martelella sp.]|uniref:NAD-dependent epimerase/dehydratase family protein n=1 Tax=Martelella sp. TaxID=1969699 RepID=UPI00324262DF